MSATITGPDGRERCKWCAVTPEYLDYHDREWGFPVADDYRLFEKLSLEGFQSGLSWRTILAKRENFRAAFHNFDFDRIARFTDNDVERLLGDAGIVRHRGKIEAVINNARLAQKLVAREGSLAAFVWQYEPDPAQLAEPQSTGIGRPIEGAEEDGLEIRRADHRLCLHAGDGADQRPCRGLRDPRRGRTGTPGLQAAGALTEQLL